MTDWVLRLPATHADAFYNNKNAIGSFVTANPGSTEAEIVTGTGLSLIIVQGVLAVARQVGIIFSDVPLAGGSTHHYWMMADWQNLISNNLNAARTWAETPGNDGLKVSDMAASLGVHDIVANGLALALHRVAVSVRSEQ